MIRDPFEPQRGEVFETEALLRFVSSFEEFMDDFFSDPPSSMRGEELEEHREAWEQLRASLARAGFHERLRAVLGVAGGLAKAAEHQEEGYEERGDSLPGGLPEAPNLVEHGLWGAPLAAKLSSYADRLRSWRRTRTCRRLGRVAEVSAGVFGSMADALGLGHAYSEAAQWVQYLSGVVVSEGG